GEPGESAAGRGRRPMAVFVGGRPETNRDRMGRSTAEGIVQIRILTDETCRQDWNPNPRASGGSCWNPIYGQGGHALRRLRACHTTDSFVFLRSILGLLLLRSISLGLLLLRSI